jgi:hypothetical protein
MMQDIQFELQVLNQIAPLTSDASFTSHTLFVACDEDLARKIFHVLTDKHGLGHVLVSKAGAEYAFDFV